MQPGTLRHVVHVRVFVRPDSWDASLAFYAAALGLSLQVRDDVHRHALFTFASGPTLGLEQDVPDDGEPPASGKFTGISFQVDDVDRVHAELVARGVTFVHPPETMFWGGRLAHLQDPSGNVLTLAQYPKPV